VEEVSRTFAWVVEQLRRSDQAQRRFLQNASHELKTPLMAIQGYAEGIKDGIFAGEEAEKGLEVIAREATRLKKLVDELIYLSKLETRDDVFHPGEHELTAIVQDGLERVGSLAMQKGVQLALIGAGEYPVFVDRDKMLQVLLNLLANGIRHARSRVEVEMSREGEQVCLIVRDDGEGFGEEGSEQVFERFYKGDKGETGLGLAIVKAIVEGSQGSVQARNGENGGAEVSVRLPLRK
jgi:signal transduction histidine kinase